MKRHLTIATLAVIGAVTVTTTAAHAANCAQRAQLVEGLESKYDEHFAAGGLQKINSKQSFMEIWASKTTGTFTVIVTSPEGISCVVAAGTDFFEAEDVPLVKGTPS